nr:hypothetical protein [Haloarcula japonica]
MPTTAASSSHGTPGVTSFFERMWTHHNANHGGFIFAPEVGLHENVHELDLTSLYPTLFIRGASRQTLS